VGRKFTGVALELTPTEAFKRKPPPTPLSLSKLVRFDRRFVSMFGLGIVLSLIGELFVLAAPFYMQVTVDEVLMKGDRQLLDALAIGFGLIVLFQVVSTTLRGLTFQLLGHVLSFDMSARVFHRMMKLPVSYFSNRQMGDVQHRVQSLEQVRHFLTGGAPMALLDGLFGAVVLCLLFAYSPVLTYIVLGATTVYVAWRLAMFGLMKRAAGDLIVAEAETQTQLLETLRSMPTLKMTAIEAEREGRWRNANARRLNANLRVGNLDIANGAFNQLLFQGLRVIVIFTAAKMALAGDMTVGMITAFVAYHGMFTQRTAALVENLVAMKLLSVPLGRIADIVLERPEPMGEDGGRPTRLRGAVEARGLAFRYGQSEAPVLMGASLKVEPGEFVALVGPSGTGKSTLLKLLSGMEKPGAGQVLFDGRPLANWNLGTLRRQVGVVLQEDTLLRGSIAENICLFDEHPDMEMVRDCCALAGIATEIEAMPMGYESQVGDMGSTLSGGQKQRVLIARALYRRPKVLFLDEATSHLDTANEAAVLEAIGNLNVTRIVIAHRPETIAAADRVLVVHGGRIVQQPKAVAPAMQTEETAPEKPSLKPVPAKALPEVAAGADFTTGLFVRP
jgi:ATP-binding cassette subfamily B protein RaxB